MILNLLGGFLIGMTVLYAGLWSLQRVFQTSGPERIAHGSILPLTILAMAAISNAMPLAGQVVGLALMLVGGALVLRTPGWTRLLPLASALFGAVMLAGLPF